MPQLNSIRALGVRMVDHDARSPGFSLSRSVASTGPDRYIPEELVLASERRVRI